jgi:hypothetical protein
MGSDWTYPDLADTPKGTTLYPEGVPNDQASDSGLSLKGHIQHFVDHNRRTTMVCKNNNP